MRELATHLEPVCSVLSAAYVEEGGESPRLAPLDQSSHGTPEETAGSDYAFSCFWISTQLLIDAVISAWPMF